MKKFAFAILKFFGLACRPGLEPEAARRRRRFHPIPSRSSLAPSQAQQKGRPMSFARYPSLLDRVVFITGGGSGIGAAMVEAFAAQKANVAFVDIAVEPSKDLVGEDRRLRAGAVVSPLRLHRHRRARGGDGGGSATAGADRRPHQQRRQRSAPGRGRDERRGLGQGDGAQPQASVLRRPDRAPLDARTRRRRDRQFFLDRLDDWDTPGCRSTPPPRRRSSA